MVVDTGVVVVESIMNLSPKQVTPTSSDLLAHCVLNQKPFLQSAIVGSEPSQSRSDRMKLVKLVASGPNRVCSSVTTLASPLRENFFFSEFFGYSKQHGFVIKNAKYESVKALSWNFPKGIFLQSTFLGTCLSPLEKQISLFVVRQCRDKSDPICHDDTSTHSQLSSDMNQGKNSGCR